MPLASHNKRTDGPVHSQLGTPGGGGGGGGGGWREMVGDEKEERDEEEVGKNVEDWKEEEERKSRVWYIYSTNTNSRPSKKQTTSLQWKSLMPPIDNPIDLVALKKPPRDGRPKQETLAMARTDLS